MDGIVNKNPVNKADGKSVHTRSQFDLSYPVFCTRRFGEYSPHFVMEAVADDKITVRSSDDTRSYTLKAPLMSDVYKNKAYFQVPYEAILPRNWDLIITNPVHGEDINAKKAGTAIYALPQKIGDIVANYQSAVPTDSSDPTADTFATNLQKLLLLEMVFSRGSLAASLGYHFSKLLKVHLTSGKADSTLGDYKKVNSIDKLVDWMISYVSTYVTSFRIYPINSNGSNYVIASQDDKKAPYYDVYTDGEDHSSDSQYAIDLRAALEIMRDGFSWTVRNITPVSGKTVATINTFMSISRGSDSASDWHVVDYRSLDVDNPGEVVPYINTARLHAYQIVCAHFFTNDKIDYVYSAELWRQNLYDAIMHCAWGPATSEDSTGIADRFEINGLQYQYDNASAFFFDYVYNRGRQSSNCMYVAEYLRLIFGYNRSLRYMDYFVGSKSQPLAVGDIDVMVDTDNNSISVVDVTRNIQRQRFFNAVNRAGRRFSEYMKEIFGTNVAPDWHNPFFLALTKDKLFGAEVENNNIDPNSSEDQAQMVTSSFRGNSEKYAFDIVCDRPCILIGITYYDIPRVYADNMNRQLFHVDRFDMFNPYMQFIGDQRVYMDEVDASRVHSQSFGYQLRHMEYKQRVGEEFGGFAEGLLPGWTFDADEEVQNVIAPHISPSYIRSRPSEMDKFYLSLSGWSLASYFHFIVKDVNSVDASRPMSYAPSIL